MSNTIPGRRKITYKNKIKNSGILKKQRVTNYSLAETKLLELSCYAIYYETLGNTFSPDPLVSIKEITALIEKDEFAIDTVYNYDEQALVIVHKVIDPPANTFCYMDVINKFGRKEPAAVIYLFCLLQKFKIGTFHCPIKDWAMDFFLENTFDYFDENDENLKCQIRDDKILNIIVEQLQENGEIKPFRPKTIRNKQLAHLIKYIEELNFEGFDLEDFAIRYQFFEDGQMDISDYLSVKYLNNDCDLLSGGYAADNRCFILYSEIALCVDETPVSPYIRKVYSQKGIDYDTKKIEEFIDIYNNICQLIL